MRRAEAGIQVDKFYPPTDWLDNNSKQIDIRKNAENNSIVLLVGVKSDFSAYKLLGLYAIISSGTYDVYIDDVLVGSAITTNTQYDIDFSQIATSYGTATTPEELVLHKVVIKPNTSGATITSFRCIRTAGVSTGQFQGCLWCHLELNNAIKLENLFSTGGGAIANGNLLALTSKGGYIDLGNSNASAMLNGSQILEYVSRIKNIGKIESAFRTLRKIKRIIIDNYNASNSTYGFNNSNNIEKIVINNIVSGGLAEAMFTYMRKLKMLPFTKRTGTSSLNNLVTEAQSLYPTKITVADTTTTKLGSFGNSTYQMRGLRGLKVSNEAPFSGSSPQIDVSYTGLDRDALVELFTSLPTVTGGQTLSLIGATGNNLTKVGSPTIDENGVASGFSLSNYFRTSQNINILSSVNKWKIQTAFSVSDLTDSPQMILQNVLGSANGILFALFKDTDNTYTLRLYAYNNGNLFSGLPTTKFNVSTKYYIQIEFTGKQYKMFMSTDGTNWSEFFSINIDTNIGISNNYLNFGVDTRNTWSPFTGGEIYLEDTYINVDRNYLMKGYITDADKNIALNKGWSLTLS